MFKLYPKSYVLVDMCISWDAYILMKRTVIFLICLSINPYAVRILLDEYRAFGRCRSESAIILGSAAGLWQNVGREISFAILTEIL